MKIDIHKPDLPKTIRMAFMHYLHDTGIVMVGYKDTEKFRAPNRIVNSFLGSSFYYPYAYYPRFHYFFWIEEPCELMDRYPVDIKHQWFGLYMPDTGQAYPVQYQRSKNNRKGDNVTVTVENKTFQWIQGDQHLTATFIMPLLIQSMLRDAQTYITDRTGVSDDRWDCLMGEIDSYINSIFKAMKAIKTLKTQRTRHKHYLSIQHDLIKPGYQAMNYLLCLQQGRDLSREPVIVRDSD